MAYKDLPSPDMLCKILAYSPDTGMFVWLRRDQSLFDVEYMPTERFAEKWNKRYAGRPAMTSATQNGYFRGTILGTSVQAHRVAWAMVNGEWPETDVDHINGVRSDNRISNLRLVTRQENMRNASMSRANKSGVVGVRWVGGIGKWVAYINVSRRQIFLGYHDLMDDAVLCRKNAEVRYGFHANHGRASI